MTNFSDGWIFTQGDIAAYMADGYLDLRTLAHDQKWRVDPATTGEMALFPQTNSFGYMVLSSYNIKVYGDGEYAYVLLSGPWYRIRVELVLKALEILNGGDPRSIYETFEELKETCPNGVTILMDRFT